MGIKKIWLIATTGAVMVISGFSAAPAQLSPQDAPGPLSRAHSKNPSLKGCLKCHAEDMTVSPTLCLSCHTEIAERQKEGQGFHRDKKEDCAVCHQEHRGEDVDLKPLDPTSFDHSETGTVLQGKHVGVRSCDRCHKPENSFPRTAGRSYLMRDGRCRACHVSPHPGRQDECASCHEQPTWRVTPWTTKKGRTK